MNIFISGICGFIGSNIAEYYALQNKDNEIYGIDNLYKDIYINKGKAKKWLTSQLLE